MYSNVDNYETFILNEEKIDAVVLNLEQIGESVKKLSDNYKETHTDIDWINIAGLRNLIPHEYEGVNLVLIYNIATIGINELLKKITD
ncbi:MAG: DUF86 domain-containing protein [Candidatus Izimaplasma sp.]|nr:DUF86 domain-containing protein [Candidatus Izimaplasma bacterium]